MPKAGRNLTLGSVLMISVFIVSALAFYGGAKLVETDSPASADAGNDELTGGPVTTTIVAKNSGFDKRAVAAAPGAQVTVTLDNQDAGVLHNVAFYGSRNYTSPLVVGTIFTGPGSDTVSFTAPDAPGNYPFRCDVHPDTMTGNLTVR